jgi:predicted nucleic acid-binding protein
VKTAIGVDKAVLVVDASVAAKWFLIEEGSAKAAVLLGGEQQLLALLRIEVAAAISRQLRLGVIDQRHALRRFQDMMQVLAAPGIVLVDNEGLLARAMNIAVELRHPLQDCLYIACAEQVGAELLTTDAGLLRRATTLFPFVRPL